MGKYVICRFPDGERFIQGRAYAVRSTGCSFGIDCYCFAHIVGGFDMNLFTELEVVNISSRELPRIGNKLPGVTDGEIQFVEYDPYQGTFLVTLTDVVDTHVAYLVTLA